MGVVLSDAVVQGRFVVAAKHHVSIAEICETELGDIPQLGARSSPDFVSNPTLVTQAMSNYETAADFFKGEQSTSSANRCLTSVAKYAAQLGDYQKAVDIYEEVGTAALASPLLKYSAKDHFFKAALCHMCVDSINAQLSTQLQMSVQIAVKKYEDISPTFTDSRECKLLKELLSSLEEQDTDSFTEAVTKFDSISRLDPWHTALLLRIKKSIAQGPDLL
ncbi:NAPA [Cordylochernes scorpioides]|uniref:NAPA n=1 Tax=Cordylochernes scorpioides TaxID=51811 RepID=A0ABY6LH06_9ARAC|nr:NAPA [Cordylochernes scorpioides]